MKKAFRKILLSPQNLLSKILNNLKIFYVLWTDLFEDQSTVADLNWFDIELVIVVQKKSLKFVEAERWNGVISGQNQIFKIAFNRIYHDASNHVNFMKLWMQY